MKFVAYAIVVVLMTHLNSLVDLAIHPEIPFFDTEHLVVGATSGLISAVLFGFLFFYTSRQQALIKSHKKAVVDARDAQKMWEQTFNAIPDIVTVQDRDRRIVLANRAASEFFKLGLDELRGRHCFELFRGNAAPCPKCPGYNLSADAAHQADVIVHAEQGKIFNVSSALILGGDNKLQYLVHIAKDITERKRAEEAIEKAAREWSTAMDASDDAIYLLDLNRHIIRANSTFYQVTGSSPATAIGRHIEEIVHPQGETVPCPVCRAQEALQDAVITMEADHPDNPAGRPLEITVKVARNDQGEPLSIFMNLHDLTNARQNQEERRKLEAQLQQALKMEAIGTLAGGIAHDFNNILTAILGYAELAREEIKQGDTDGVVADLGELVQGANRARDLVRQILTFSRQSGHQRKVLKPHPVVKESMKLLRATTPTTITIGEEIDAECGSILADPTKLNQIVLNLFTNAVHAIENEQGSITVSLKEKELREADIGGEFDVKPGAFVELAVADTGQGMEQKVLERIFDPYFTTKQMGRGTGLGLAVVHGIVKECGGMIKIDSRVGKGSTFRIYFPVTEEETAGPAGKAETVQPPTGSERVLFVDDEVPIVKLQKSILQSLGYAVTAETSSVKALEIFRDNPWAFDLVITDQTMPEMSGTDFIGEVLKIRADIPVILCTGYSSMVSEDKAREMGFNGFIMKPYDIKQLATVVRNALDNRQLEAASDA